MHANAATDVPARLEALGAIAGLPPGAIRIQAGAALDAVVHVTRDGSHRRVTEIAAVDRDTSGDLLLLPALRDVEPTSLGPGWHTLATRLGLDPSHPPGPDDVPRDLYAVRDLATPSLAIPTPTSSPAGPTNAGTAGERHG